ncbi:3924_t:CDS:1, partial [Acaulospora morrowiae]
MENSLKTPIDFENDSMDEALIDLEEEICNDSVEEDLRNLAW